MNRRKEKSISQIKSQRMKITVFFLYIKEHDAAIVHRSGNSIILDFGDGDEEYEQISDCWYEVNGKALVLF